jgi:histidinol-phosphate/aromatic aminotransferase/cobyric acid decarboxylase-like protein/N-acyl-L-homoserine lactone synthetase
MHAQPMRITLSLADERDRESIYAMRHQVYARELRQHAENPSGQLRDNLDEVNTYLVAKRSGEVLGFVAVTPPSAHGYSLDKYFAREDLPLIFDRGLYEVRLLTVTGAHRGTPLALLLMYSALRYVESRGATTIAAIGRLEVLEMYKWAGLASLGLRVKSGEVTYELMAADVRDLQARLAGFAGTLSRLERLVDWQVSGVPFHDNLNGDACYHGGAFFEAIGEEFETLEKKDAIINADVLDAWFDPAPSVVKKLAEHLPFALRTSPPTGCDGMRRAIARARGVADDSILPGAGSSDLIFAGLRLWVTPRSRVLILDPMYGEYAHVLEKVIGAQVDRLTLSEARDYEVDLDELAAHAARGYDWVVLVNPNSPTGCHIPRRNLELVLAEAPRTTRWWIDETYVDYAGPGQSLEACASSSANVVICKSMSKVYALSGARAAYLCGPASMMDELKPLCPPWSVSLPGQIAACEALKAIDYYHARWEETHHLRGELREGLKGLGWEVLPGCANFLLCHLPANAPEAAKLVEQSRKRGLFVRDVANMGTCFDGRTLRVAVKDRDTNLVMLEILRMTLAEMASTRPKAAA